MTDKPSFAERWSHRKRAVTEELEEDVVEGPEEVEPEDDERTDSEILADLNLKDPDELEAGDDFSGFMDTAIPQRLRNRALRKLWLSNPALANLDDLLDYGEDFTNKGALVENIATAYKVGKGFVDKLAEDDEIAPESTVSSDVDGSTETDEPVEKRESTPTKNVRKPEEIRAMTPLPSETQFDILPDEATKQPETRRKRMNFEF